MPSSGPQVNYGPYQPSGMLIDRQNSYAFHSRQCTGCCIAQSREPVKKVKKEKPLCIYGKLRGDLIVVDIRGQHHDPAIYSFEAPKYSALNFDP
jgi:hypothetical protein